MKLKTGDTIEIISRYDEGQKKIARILFEHKGIINIYWFIDKGTRAITAKHHGINAKDWLEDLKDYHKSVKVNGEEIK